MARLKVCGVWQLWCIYKERRGRRQFTQKAKTLKLGRRKRKVQTQRATDTAAEERTGGQRE